jgi:hypothetical protein
VCTSVHRATGYGLEGEVISALIDLNGIKARPIEAADADRLLLTKRIVRSAGR